MSLPVGRYTCPPAELMEHAVDDVRLLDGGILGRPITSRPQRQQISPAISPLVRDLLEAF